MEKGENVWRYLSRAYLDLQQLRVACQARLRKMKEQKVPEDVQALMKDYYLTLKEEEKDFLARITDRLKDNPLYEWTSRVKGMGPVACLIFLGFIDPQKASTAGKAKAYFGCVPGSGLKSGKRSKFNPLAKGRAWLITRNVIMARDEYYHCYSEDTRVMTRDGLKDLSEISHNDEIMTLNPLTREIEYQKPIKIHVYNYSGEMVHFEGRFTDILVTPNHRMVIDNNNSMEFIDAGEIIRRYGEAKKKRGKYVELHAKTMEMLKKGFPVGRISEKLGVPRDTIYGWKYGKKPMGIVGRGAVIGILRQVRRAVWRGKDVPHIEIPRVHYKGHPGNILSKVNTELWMKFLGWYLSEGSCWQAKNKKQYTFSFGSKKEDVCEFREVLNGLGFKYSQVQFSNVPGIVFNSKQLYRYFEDNRGAKNKYIPSEVKELSPKYLEVLLETLIKGDGTSTRGKNFRYSTISKKLAEDVLEIAIKCGYGVSILTRTREVSILTRTHEETEYNVGIQKFRVGVTLPRPHLEPYKGKVWCVSTPNGIIMVERNGKLAWCGNSLYRKKKEYYMENARKVFLNGEWVTWPPFKDIIKDPTCCPKYHECLKRLKGKAERLKRKQKKLPCRLHVDQMAKRWLMGILISNAAELMREAAGLDTTNYKSHHSYIAPKPEG